MMPRRLQRKNKAQNDETGADDCATQTPFRSSFEKPQLGFQQSTTLLIFVYPFSSFMFTHARSISHSSLLVAHVLFISLSLCSLCSLSLTTLCLSCAKVYTLLSVPSIIHALTQIHIYIFDHLADFGLLATLIRLTTFLLSSPIRSNTHT